MTVGVLVGRKLLGKAGSSHAAAPSAIDLSFATTVADALATKKVLQCGAAGEEGKVDRLRYFFLYRRAVELGLADASLRVAPGLATLQQRVAQQFGQVEQFLTPLVGTALARARGPYFGGPLDPAQRIHHLDLGFYVSVRLVDPAPTTEAAAVAASSPSQAQVQTLRELDVRKMRVNAIVWRAAAIEPDVWAGTGNDAALKPAELTKLLDRRLRAVERLHYEVSAGVTQDRRFSDSPSNRTSTTEGPWSDGFVLHAVERPSMPRTARSFDGSWAVEDFFLNQHELSQLLQFDGNATGGSFTLEFDGDVSPAIAFDADQTQIQTAIHAMRAASSLTVTGTNGSMPDSILKIVLTGIMNPGSQLKVHSNNLTGTQNPTPKVRVIEDITAVETRAVPRFSLDQVNRLWFLNHSTDELDWNLWPGTRLVGNQWKPVPESGFKKNYGWMLVPRADTQSLSISGAPTGGKFTLSFNGQATTEIGVSASAETVRKALAALPGGGPKVVCMGGPLPGSVTFYLHPSVSPNALAIGANQLTGDPQAAPQFGLRNPAKGDQPADTINELFALLVPPKELPPASNGNPQFTPSFNRSDWWARSWLHSDGVMSGLHLEALRFALMRQPQATGIGLRPDDEFNELPWKFGLALDDCFELREVTHVSNGIMAKGKNEYFENGAALLDDLQIGDQVLFDTNPALVALGTTAWDYPTVLVTDLDTPPDKPGINLGELKLQGLGTDELSMPDFQLLHISNTDAILKRVQEYIPAEIARLSAKAAAAGEPFTPPTKLPWDIGIINLFERATGDDTLLRLWSPYADDTWDAPGPWWLWINAHTELWRAAFGLVAQADADADDNDDDDGLDVSALLARIPGALIMSSTTQVTFANRPNPWRATGASPVIATRADFQPPPLEDLRDTLGDANDVIFVPLFQPMGGWETYFETKFNTPADSRWPPQLDPVRSDARWFSGLATSPTDPQRVRVIRPRAKPNP